MKNSDVAWLGESAFAWEGVIQFLEDGMSVSFNGCTV